MAGAEGGRRSRRGSAILPGAVLPACLFLRAGHWCPTPSDTKVPPAWAPVDLGLSLGRARLARTGSSSLFDVAGPASEAPISAHQIMAPHRVRPRHSRIEHAHWRSMQYGPRVRWRLISRNLRGLVRRSGGFPVLLVPLQGVQGVRSAPSSVTATITGAAAPICSTALSTATMGARPVAAVSSTATSPKADACHAAAATAWHFTTSTHRVGIDRGQSNARARRACKTRVVSCSTLTATVVAGWARLPLSPRNRRGRRGLPGLQRLVHSCEC